MKPQICIIRKRFSNNYVRAGLTLIEVIASLVILGGVLVALIIVKAHVLRQQHQSRECLIATEVLDELMYNWIDPETRRLVLPKERGGQIDTRWNWSISPLGPVEPYGNRISIVRVHLYDNMQVSGSIDRSSISLDLVIANEYKYPNTFNEGKL